MAAAQLGSNSRPSSKCKMLTCWYVTPYLEWHFCQNASGAALSERSDAKRCGKRFSTLLSAAQTRIPCCLLLSCTIVIVAKRFLTPFSTSIFNGFFQAHTTFRLENLICNGIRVMTNRGINSLSFHVCTLEESYYRIQGVPTRFDIWNQ